MQDQVEVLTSEIDQALSAVLKLRAEEEAADEIKKALYHKRKAAEASVLELVKKAGKTKWILEGIGTMSVVNTLSVQVPKTNADKRQLWDFIVQKYGEDAAYDKFSMHSKTLVSFYNEEMKACEDASLFTLPGVGEPTYQEEFRFRKA